METRNSYIMNLKINQTPSLVIEKKSLILNRMIRESLRTEKYPN